MKLVTVPAFVRGLTEVDLSEGPASFSRTVRISGYDLPVSTRWTGSDKLAVFFPGAHAISQPKPKFQRRKYFDVLDCNCIGLFDPTLFLQDDLSLGWFQGGRDVPHFERAAELISAIAAKMEIENSKIFLFGTSAGGIPVIKVSEKIPACKAFVGNPQTNVLKYYKEPVKKLLGLLSPDVALSEASKMHMNIIGTATKAEVYYAQNIEDKFHFEDHYLPFRNSRPDINYVVYRHPTGHNPIGSRIEVDVIRRILSGQSVQEAYGDFLVDQSGAD